MKPKNLKDIYNTNFKNFINPKKKDEPMELNVPKNEEPYIHIYLDIHITLLSIILLTGVVPILLGYFSTVMLISLCILLFLVLIIVGIRVYQNIQVKTFKKIKPMNKLSHIFQYIMIIFVLSITLSVVKDHVNYTVNMYDVVKYENKITKISDCRSLSDNYTGCFTPNDENVYLIDKQTHEVEYRSLVEE